MIPTTLVQIPGLGPKTIEKLNKLNIFTPNDLLYHFPHRYIDFSHTLKIKDVSADQNVTISGTISYFKNIYTRFGKNIQKAVISDSTGQIDLIWFNQPYLANTILVGQKISVAGNVTLYNHKFTIISPEYGQYNTGKIVAVYPETRGLGSKWFRKTIHQFLPLLVQNITDPLPAGILSSNQLLDLPTALKQIHLPDSPQLIKQALLRLSLDEILTLQAQSLIQKQEWLKISPKYVLKTTPAVNKSISKLIDNLPFKLTPAQQDSWQEIKSDLSSPHKVTNRLLQGDVGSGKTIIAILSAYLCHLNSALSLVIAPTEILSLQHFQTFQKFLPKDVPLYLLTSSSPLDLKKIPPNSIIISTHASIYQKKSLQNKLALLIVDEQHKFGVKQRSFLSSFKYPPHSITMTATPIPRTISLTMLGNLDLSTIDTLPKNRLPVKTFLVPQSKKEDCYQWIKNQIKKTGQQAFVVCPFINESESLLSVKSAITQFDTLKNSVFPDLNLGLIHGKMNTKDREDITTRFRQNKLNILVTTPIIEVGVDIPNATIIVILSADRFGLAQLHQLRGRVGRGGDQSYCYLFTESENSKALDRLKFLAKTNNGLDIAQYDLKTRGPGEAFSTIQHGLPSLKIAQFNDLKLINFAQKVLKELISQPNFDPKQLLDAHHRHSVQPFSN